MGLRTASVRRLSSVAMAPALTETNTFKLTPKTSTTCNQSSAASVADVAFDDSDTAASTTTQTTAIVRKGVKGDAEAPFDLTHLQLAAEFLNKGDITLERCKLPPTDNGIMNNQDLTIQPPNITTNMGLQQQFKEDKSVDGQQPQTIVDHMFANLPPLHTDDDLMQQVIKSMESGVVDSNEELVEELPLTASDLVATLQPGNLSSLENALFSAVDMMNIGGMVEQMMVDQPAPAIDNRDERSMELLAQVQTKQARLERKHDFLLRRLGKMQMRYMGQHISAEVAGVYEHVHRTLRRLKEQGNTQPQPQDNSGSTTATASFDSSSAAALDLSVSAQQGKGCDGEVLKPISHGAAKSLVKKLENTRYLQATSASRQRHSARFFGSGSIEPTSFRTPTTSSTSSTLTLLPPWAPADKTSLQQTAGQLRAQVALLQGQLDSDATVSSSGGESCDEMTAYGNVHQQYLAIQKRAAWKYSSARASIAARWSWLLAQIADLEYRIKQHNDLQRNIRTSKGPIILCSAVLANAATTTTNSAVNGYRGILPGDIKTAISGEGSGGAGISLSNSSPSSTDQSSPSCSRIRPLNISVFTKRRLVQTGGLHLVSKKAARPSTVRCACIADVSSGNRNVWGGSNCAVCTGRSDPTLPRDPTDHLSRMERIALLDGGYHPVVSLPEDTSISVHMEAIMKSVEWQQRSSRSSLKAMKYAIKADRVNSDRNEKYQQGGSSVGVEQQRVVSGKKSGCSEHRRKYNRISGSSVKGSTVNALTAKLKSGRPRGRKPNSSNNRHNNNNNSVAHKKRRRHSHHHQRTREHSTSAYSNSYNASSSLLRDSDDDDYLDEDDYVSHGQKDAIDQYVIGQHGGGSRSGSPLLATQSISGFGRRNRVDSYDIDNIVIPYSVAASTRVERLQYKEILTPKWRLIDSGNLPPIKYENKNNGVVKITSQENEVSDVEDNSDEAVHVRHDKSEQEEKRKFLSYLKLPLGCYGTPASRRHLQALHHNNNHRRTDSRAESSGANTPDNPMSPAPTNLNVETTAVQPQQQQMGETPVSSPPAVEQLGASKGEELPESLRNLPLSSLSSLRRRTISSSRWLQRDSTSNDSTEQSLPPIVEIPPFDRRQFPLSEESYDKMVRGMPEGHRRGTGNQPMMNIRNQDNSETESTSVAASSSSVPPTTSKPASEADPRRRRSTQQTTTTAVIDHGHAGCSIIDDIDSESTESAFGDEDPNDPEWDLEDQISRNSHDGMGRFRR